ncbi:uncharacterized protein LOC133320366 [Danaus plexippus]|uniref:uncharacterized protein LOC133320366 n=1 Tax=Danaus plexippus TaxID=13037 RepID=UPI002AB101C0|nr:uncharacterized protein LOC133320366 [Danaus plexippus]
MVHSDCSRVAPTEEPPSCVLFGQQGHPANFRGCPKAPHWAKAGRKPYKAQEPAPIPAAHPANNAWHRPRFINEQTAPQAPKVPMAPQATQAPKATQAPQAPAQTPAIGLAADLQLVCDFASLIDPAEVQTFAAKLMATDSNPQARMLATCQHAGMLSAMGAFKANGN